MLIYENQKAHIFTIALSVYSDLYLAKTIIPRMCILALGAQLKCLKYNYFKQYVQLIFETKLYFYSGFFTNTSLHLVIYILDHRKEDKTFQVSSIYPPNSQVGDSLL